MNKPVIAKTALAVAMSLAIAACQSVPNQALQDAPWMPSADLPKRTAGEYFLFDDGTRYTVENVRGDIIHWKTNGGVKSRSLVNFLIPEFDWESTSRISNGRTDASSRSLWPLKIGNEASFTVSQTVSRKDGSREPIEMVRPWKCQVTGTETVLVRAGTFDTYIINCDRFSATSGSLRASRIFYYAPEVGHYVLRKDVYQSRKDRHRELVRSGFNSLYLGKADQRVLKKVLSKTLNHNTDGVAATWVDRSKRITALLVPTDSYRNDDKENCREYKSIYSVTGYIRTNARDVCKEGRTNQWVRVD